MKSFAGRRLEGVRSSVTPLRFLDQYKPSTTFIVFLWKQTCTEYNTCDALAPSQAVTLKTPESLSFPSLCFISAFFSPSLVCFNWRLIEQVPSQALLLDMVLLQSDLALWSTPFISPLTTCNSISKPTCFAIIIIIYFFQTSEKGGEKQNEAEDVCVSDLRSRRGPGYLQLVNYLFAAGRHGSAVLRQKHTCPQAWPRRPRCPTVFLL